MVNFSATIQLHVLYVFIVLAHDRRRILHFNITDHPTAVWAAQQIVEAFPEATCRITWSGIAMEFTASISGHELKE